MLFLSLLIPALVTAAGAYLSAKEQNKVAKEASKPREQTQTSVPYANEYISKLVPYILSEQQKIYESRLKGYGLEPGNFSPIASMLAGIPSSYSGVSAPPKAGVSVIGTTQYNPAGGGYNPFSAYGGGVPAGGLSEADRLAAVKAALLSAGVEGKDRGAFSEYYKDSPDRGSRFDTGAESPFGPAGFSGVGQSDSAEKAAGAWLLNALLGGFNVGQKKASM